MSTYTETLHELDEIRQRLVELEGLTPADARPLVSELLRFHDATVAGVSSLRFDELFTTDDAQAALVRAFDGEEAAPPVDVWMPEYPGAQLSVPPFVRVRHRDGRWLVIRSAGWWQKGRDGFGVQVMRPVPDRGERQPVPSAHDGFVVFVHDLDELVTQVRVLLR